MNYGRMSGTRKSAWYLVDYDWIQGKWKWKMNQGKNRILEATNKSREIVPLRYLKAKKAMFMFGIYIAPDGNNKYYIKSSSSSIWDYNFHSYVLTIYVHLY